MITTILFDIGGVITFSHFRQLYINFAQAANINPDFVMEYHMTNWDDLLLGNISGEQFWRDLAKLSANPDQDFAGIWIKEALAIREINTELLDAIKELRKQYKVGSLTNLSFSRMMVDETQNIFSHFDFNILSCIEHLKKPDPAFYQLALDKTKAEPSQVIFIDDRERNTAAAESLGMHGIIYTDNGQLEQDLQKFGIDTGTN